MKISQEDEIMI